MWWMDTIVVPAMLLLLVIYGFLVLADFRKRRQRRHARQQWRVTVCPPGLRRSHVRGSNH